MQTNLKHYTAKGKHILWLINLSLLKNAKVNSFHEMIGCETLHMTSTTFFIFYSCNKETGK